MNIATISESQALSSGSLWERGTMRRIYINITPEHAGLEVRYYKTGNVKFAKHQGETLANNRATEYLAVLRDVKVWFDCDTGRIAYRLPRLGRVPGWVVEEAIQAALTEASEETTTAEEPDEN